MMWCFALGVTVGSLVLLGAGGILTGLDRRGRPQKAGTNADVWAGLAFLLSGVVLATATLTIVALRSIP